MKSKKSFCNKEIMKQDIIRFWPLWALLLAGLQLRCVLPTLILAVFGVEGVKNEEYKNILVGNGIENMFKIANPVLIAILCIVTAVLVFGYLFKKKETYMLHSFPVGKREYFCTHVLSGLLMLLAPYVLTYLLTWIILAVFGGNIIGMMGVTLLEVMVMIVFFYSLSCLVVMLSGNAPISLIIYGVSNVLVKGLLMLVGGVAEFFVNYVGSYTISSGTSTIASKILDYATPVKKFARIIGDQDVFTSAFAGSEITVPWQQFGAMVWYIIPAVICLVLADILYQRRALERVGDSLAFPWGKPVFIWVFTICGSNIFTIILYGLGLNNLKENIGSYHALFWVGMGCQLLGCLVCFAIGHMILQRTFRVWKQLSLVQMGICIFCVLAIMLFARYNNYHITVPDGKDVKRMQVQISNTDVFFSDTGAILVERQKDIEKILEAVQEMFDGAEDMPVKNDMDVTGADIVCEGGGESVKFTVGYLGETYYRKQYEAICAVLNDSDTMMEKIFSRDYKTLREDEYTFSLVDKEYEHDIDATELNLHKKEVLQALEADVRAGNIQLCGQKNERIVSLEVSLNSPEDLSDSDREGTSRRAEAIEDAYDVDEADDFYRKVCISVTGKCTNLWKLFQKLDIETNAVVEVEE